MEAMVDIETLGTHPGCAILQIAAARFERNTFDQPKIKTWNISLESCTRVGLDINPKTLLWWLKQDDAAIKSVFDETNAVDLVTALGKFNLFIGGVKYIWTRGVFDLPIIREAMVRSKLDPAWNYTKEREVRTYLEAAGVEPCKNPDTIQHTAADDCFNQIADLRGAYQVLRANRELALEQCKGISEIGAIAHGDGGM